MSAGEGLIGIHPRGVACGCHGFSAVTPIGVKSAALRVTTVRPCTRAVAANRIFGGSKSKSSGSFWLSVATESRSRWMVQY